MTLAKSTSLFDDHELVQRCVGGDRPSREILARECLPLVRKLVYLSYGQRADTEDVVQKALVVIFRDMNSLRDPGAIRTWMYRVTCNVIATHSARKSRLLNLFSFEPDLDAKAMAESETPEYSTSRQRLFDRIGQHLTKIKYKKRTAVILSLFFGYVDSEIGEIMGCSSETAKKRVQHGRRELIRAVQKDSRCRELLEEDAI